VCARAHGSPDAAAYLLTLRFRYRIRTDVKEELDAAASFQHDRALSLHSAGLYCRQLAIHANLAATMHRKLQGNWGERLKQIKAIRKTYSNVGESGSAGGSDFTSFT